MLSIILESGKWAHVSGDRRLVEILSEDTEPALCAGDSAEFLTKDIYFSSGCFYSPSLPSSFVL